MRGIRQHPLTQPLLVLAALALVCGAAFAAVRFLPHEARLERWIAGQPGIAEARVSPGPMKDASDYYASASAGVAGELDPSTFATFADSYARFVADHRWSTDWGMTVSDGRISLPVSRSPAGNERIAALLALLVKDPDVLEVSYETRYFFAVIVVSADPSATRTRLAPALTGVLSGTQVIAVGEALHP